MSPKEAKPEPPKAAPPAPAPEAPAQPDDKTRAELEELGETMNAMKKMSIQEIMRQDPKFIERAINGLDKMMSQLAQRKASAEKQIADDRREIEGIDKEIGMFHQKLKTVSEHLDGKKQERERLGSEYEASSKAITSTVRDAEALFSKARMLNRRMARRAASDHLTTMRGFTTTETTREYISAAPKNIGRKGLHETTSKLKMEPPAPTPPPSGAPATGKVGIATASRERTLGTRLTQRGQRGPLSKIGIARLALLAGAASWAAAGCANQGMRRKSGLTAGRRSL